MSISDGWKKPDKKTPQPEAETRTSAIAYNRNKLNAVENFKFKNTTRMGQFLKEAKKHVAAKHRRNP